MGLIPDLKVWAFREKLRATDLNSAFGAIRDTVNQWGMFKDVAGTVTAVHTYSVAPVFSAGITSAGNVVATGTAQFVGNGAGLTNLNPTAIGSGGVLPEVVIPGLDAAKIITGTLDPARVPNLSASKVTTGVFDLARIPSIPAGNVAAGTFAGAFTFSTALTAAGVVSTGVDRSTKTTGTASSGTYAMPRTTNYHRVLIQHTSPVTITIGAGEQSEIFALEVLQGSTPQSYSFAGTGGVTVRYSNTVAPPGTVIANRKDVWGILYTSATEVLVWQVVVNTDSVA
jgi:hypothetical protein